LAEDAKNSFIQASPRCSRATDNVFAYKVSRRGTRLRGPQFKKRTETKKKNYAIKFAGVFLGANWVCRGKEGEAQGHSGRTGRERGSAFLVQDRKKNGERWGGRMWKIGVTIKVVEEEPLRWWEGEQVTGKPALGHATAFPIKIIGP